MITQRFSDVLAQTRLNLDPDHHSSADPGQNTEIKKLPPYSPFLNILEQSMSALKAAIKADVNAQRCNNKWTIVKKPGDKVSHWGIIELSSCYKRYSEMSAQLIISAKCGQWFRFM